jgi:hypothetical protein
MEVKKVNRKMKRSLGVGTVLAVLLAVAVLAAGVAPAFALTTYHEYTSAGATVVINPLDSLPKMELICQHFESSSDHGPGNQINFELISAKGFVPVAIFTTSPARATFAPTIWVGLPAASNVILVNSWDIQVFRIGKIVIVWWAVPIEGTITGDVPGTLIPWSAALGVSSFDLPPGSLILNGYGTATTSTTVAGPLPSGWTITSVSTVYNAHGTFLCPSWHYFGPVADTPTPTISTDGELTITGP